MLYKSLVGKREKLSESAAIGILNESLSNVGCALLTLLGRKEQNRFATIYMKSFRRLNYLNTFFFYQTSADGKIKKFL